MVKDIHLVGLCVVGHIGPLACRCYDVLAAGMMREVPQNVAGRNVAGPEFQGERCRTGRRLERGRVTP